MKRICTLAAIVVCCSSFVRMLSIDDVVKGMKAGDAAQVAKYFDTNVEITTPDKSNNYSRSQAEMVLKDFFANTVVKSFEVIHKGQNGGDQFCIGTLLTKAGVFRTTIYMKQKGDQQLLQEIQFENR